jgi:hypothetical protein
MTSSSRRQNGWMAASARLQRGLPAAADPPPEPPEFERLLQRAGVKETEAAKNPQVRQWVKSFYRTKFVPEKILDEIGLVVDVIYW